MEFACLLPVSCLDSLLVCILFYTKDTVVVLISVDHKGVASLLMPAVVLLVAGQAAAPQGVGAAAGYAMLQSIWLSWLLSVYPVAVRQVT